MELRSLGRCVVLYSIFPMLPFGSVVACVLRDPVILGSALYEGYLIVLYRSTMYFIRWLLYL